MSGWPMLKCIKLAKIYVGKRTRRFIIQVMCPSNILSSTKSVIFLHELLYHVFYLITTIAFKCYLKYELCQTVRAFCTVLLLGVDCAMAWIFTLQLTKSLLWKFVVVLLLRNVSCIERYLNCVRAKQPLFTKYQIEATTNWSIFILRLKFYGIIVMHNCPQQPSAYKINLIWFCAYFWSVCKVLFDSVMRVSNFQRISSCNTNPDKSPYQNTQMLLTEDILNSPILCEGTSYGERSV